MKDKELIEKALAVRNNAVAPFSDFRVGAALLTTEGNVYCGCNMENSAYSPTICAERAAFAAAISAGERHFKRIAVAGDSDDYCYPCGVCRQVMAEYCEDDFEILAVKTVEEYRLHTLGELLPHAFRLNGVLNRKTDFSEKNEKKSEKGVDNNVER